MRIRTWPLLLALLVGCNRHEQIDESVLRAKPASACQIAREARKLIGKTVKVEGYIADLSSHGLALVGKQRCALKIIMSDDDVYRAFMKSYGYRDHGGLNRAVLVATISWTDRHLLPGRTPALDIKRVDYLSQQETSWTEVLG